MRNSYTEPTVDVTLFENKTAVLLKSGLVSDDNFEDGGSLSDWQ